MERTCKYCGQIKASDLFYNTVTCKPCWDDRARQRSEKYRASAYGKQKTKERRVKFLSVASGREYIREGVKRWRQQYPLARNAQAAVERAIKQGSLKPWPVCADPSCSCEKVEAHHPDYSSPLDVVWLCRQHHKDAHKVG